MFFGLRRYKDVGLHGLWQFLHHQVSYIFCLVLWRSDLSDRVSHGWCLSSSRSSLQLCISYINLQGLLHWTVDVRYLSILIWKWYILFIMLVRSQDLHLTSIHIVYFNQVCDNCNLHFLSIDDPSFPDVPNAWLWVPIYQVSHHVLTILPWSHHDDDWCVTNIPQPLWVYPQETITTGWMKGNAVLTCILYSDYQPNKYFQFSWCGYKSSFIDGHSAQQVLSIRLTFQLSVSQSLVRHTPPGVSPDALILTDWFAPTGCPLSPCPTPADCTAHTSTSHPLTPRPATACTRTPIPTTSTAIAASFT